MTWSTRRRNRRRRVRGTLLLSTAAVCAVLGGWMLTFDKPAESDHLSTVASLFTGLVSLFLALVDFFRDEPPPLNPAVLADDLALILKEQWLEEATARGLHDPRVLPLAWAATDRNVTQLPRAANARVLRVRLDGRLENRFDEVIERLANGYAQLPHRRLVAIGEPGSGKSVLAILLTLGLLGTREAGGPVPVLLPASSWDPVREPLDDWIVRTLALPYYNSRPEIPRTLLTHGLLLPVLDGLDEIPESARRSAVQAVNVAIGAERPVVVTCRAAEYEDLIRGGAPTLRDAPVIEVSPVAPNDVIAYLRDVDWRPGTDWSPVYAHLRSERDSPLAEALSTPLMVTSARLVYQRLDLDPSELLDRSRFDCRLAVERHVTDQLIDAAYTHDPRRPDTGPSSPWTAEQARRWLTFLARYLHDHRERDLAWWRMSERLLSPWFAPAFGVVAGLVFGIGALVWIAWTDIVPESDTGAYPVIGGSVGGGFALLSIIVWYSASGRAPGRLSFSVRGSLERLRRGFRGGVLVTAFAVAPVLLVITSATVLGVYDGPGSFYAMETYCQMSAVALCLMLIIGLALAAHNWLDAPPHHAAQVSPLKSLAQDRLSALVGAGVAGCVVGATGLFAGFLGMFSGAWLIRAVNDWVGWPGDRNVTLLAAETWRSLLEAFGSNVFARLGLTVLLPGAVFGLLLLLTRAWPRFLLVRLFLAARGRLPLRLLSFLADARRRELLRQSGGVYQFRHVRLQEALAGRPLYADGTPQAVRNNTARRRLVLTAGVAAAITGAVASRTRDDSDNVFAAGRFGVTALAFHPGPQIQLAMSAYDESIWLWTCDERGRSVRKELIIRAESGLVSSMYLHPDRPLIAVTDGSATRIWNTRTGQSQRLFTSATSYPLVTFSPDGELLATCDRGGELRLWRMSTDGTFAPVSSRSGLSAAAFAPDGTTLFAVDDQGRVGSYSVPSLTPGQQLGVPLDAESAKKYDTARDLTVNWQDGLLAFVRTHSKVGRRRAELWTRPAPEAPWTVTRGVPGAWLAAVSPTAPLLATAGFNDHDLHLWHCTPGGRAVVHRHTLTGHTAGINAIAFSPLGDFIATASDDSTVRLWRTDRYLRGLTPA